MMNRILFSLFLFAAFYSANAQTTIKGTFLDSLTRQPVAFVHIIMGNGKSGTTSDIEGNFTLTIPLGHLGSLYTSHISYKRKHLAINDLIKQKTFLLSPESIVLKDFVFTAEENPAFRIIRNAIANKAQNDPENLRSYQYKSYNKFLVTMSQPTAKSDSLVDALKHRPDTVKLKKGQKSMLKFDSMIQTTHLFFSESVTEKNVIRPNLSNEKLLALKVSGFKSPLFTNVATDYQPFTFYQDNLFLLGKDFVNPLAKGTFSRYDFYLIDTSYLDTDTVFIIQYQPKPKTFFSGLTGILSITNKDYAIKNVIANSSDTLALTKIRIRQNYEKIDGHWFPVQLNTDLDFIEQKIFGRHLVAHHRSFLKDIQINPLLLRSSFSDIATDLTLPAPKENEQTLAQYRNTEPNKKESRTYTLLDSALRKARWLDKAFDAVAAQAIPMGPLEWNLNEIVQANNYEKIRLGAGLYTSPVFSKRIRLGGYAGYGFGDDRWKYGGEVKLNLQTNRDLFVRLSYANDIYATGYTHENHEGQLVSNRSLLTWALGQFDRYESIKMETGYRLMPDVHGSVFVTRGQITPTYNYRLDFNGELQNRFTVAETGITIRYVRDENYMRLNGRKVLLGSSFPTITFTAAKAIDGFDAQHFTYSYYDLAVTHLIKLRSGMKSYVGLSAGLMDGIAPYGKLYNGRGADAAGFYIENYFQTMGLNEFITSRYASLFLNHNFGNVLLNKRYSKPELLLFHNMGIGTLENAQVHVNIPIKAFDKGFYESGIGLHNLLRIKYANVAYFGFGGSLFYRYGNYAFPKTTDNLFWRLNFGISF